MVRDYYREELNINISDYYRNNNWYIQDSKIIMRNFQKEGFRVIEGGMRKNDIILFGDEDDISHLGIFLENDLMIHHPRGNKSCIEYLNHHYKNRIGIIIRHKNYEQAN